MFERRLPVESVRVLSDRYFVLSFRSPEIARASRPGQFLMIAARDAVDPLLRRPMAVYGVQREGGEPVGFSVLIEIVGRGTRLLAAARPGDELRVLAPLGRPFPIGPVAGVETLLVMGGVGAAPFPFLAGELRASGALPRAFIGGRSVADLLCVQDFERLGVPAEVATEDGSAGTHGFVTRALQSYLDGVHADPVLYSCGPTPMMKAVDQIARARGLQHFVSLEAPMACGLGVCLSCVIRVGTEENWHYVRSCREGPVVDAADLVWE